MDLEEKVRALEKVVIELSERVLAMTTPTKKGTKKRRKVNQHLTPSPSHTLDQKDEEDDDRDGDTRAESVGQQSEDDEEITTEEILKMYESG